MAIVKSILRKLERFIPTVEAHCDIPCGIYDPHHAQIAAHTVVRMTDLILELGSTPKKTEDLHKLARYTAVKEEHAELLKREVRVLWGDYFKPEHTKKFPLLNDLIWRILKEASACRQEISKKHAQELLKSTQELAEIFWKTKGLTPVKVKAPYPSGGHMILHK